MYYDKYGPEIVEDLYSQFGPARLPGEIDPEDDKDKGELPEMAFYRCNDEFMTAAAEFAVDPKNEETQDGFISARENLRNSFRVLVAQTLVSSEVDDNLKRTHIISTAYKDKDEDRATMFNRLFPEGLFTAMPLDHDQLVSRVGLLVLSRGDTASGRLSIVDEMVEEFTRFVSKDVYKAYAIALDEEEAEQEPTEDFDSAQEDITEFILQETVSYNPAEWDY